jgi:hypothetical protein
MEEKDNAELARLMMEELLLGRVHTLMVVASRYKRLGLSGISGDLQGQAE